MPSHTQGFPFDLTTDPPEDIYLLSKLLFDRLNYGLPAQDRISKLKGDLLALDKALLEAPWHCVEARDFCTAEKRAVYLYRFLLSQINAVRWSYKHMMGAHLMDCEKDCFRVVSLGGGIGSDLLGVSVSLSEDTGKEFDIGVTFLEDCNAWEQERQAICAAVACCGHRASVLSVGLRENISVHEHHVRECDLICFIHAVRIMSEEMLSEWLPTVLKAASPQATILVVDFPSPRLARLCEIIYKAGFTPALPVVGQAPHGLESVPAMERSIFLNHFKDIELQLGSLPLLYKPSSVHIYRKRVQEPYGKFAANFPTTVFPPPQSCSGASPVFPNPEKTPLQCASFIAEDKSRATVGNKGFQTDAIPRNVLADHNGGPCTPPSPRESGEIESGEDQDSPGGMQIVSSPSPTQACAPACKELMNREHLLDSNNKEAIQASDRREDLLPTAELTIGVQLFAKYKVGSQVFRANTFSEAKKRAVIDTISQEPAEINELGQDERKGVLEWVECRQGQIKRPKFVVPEGFGGRIQWNKEPSQTFSKERQQTQTQTSPQAQPWQMTLEKPTICSKIISQ